VDVAASPKFLHRQFHPIRVFPYGTRPWITPKKFDIIYI
jgi:hypothetical protein